MSIDTQLELLDAALYGWAGFTVGVGACTGNWSLALFVAAGFCTGRAVSSRKWQQKHMKE